MSLCGLQDSWGGGAGGAATAADVPQTIMAADGANTQVLTISTAAGVRIWDIAPLVAGMGITTVLNPPAPPQTLYTGQLEVTLRVESDTTGGNTVLTAGAFSLLAGTAAIPSNTNSVVLAEFSAAQLNFFDPVIQFGGISGVYTATVSTPNPLLLKLGLLWNGVAGTGGGTFEVTINPRLIKMLPIAPVTTLAATIPAPV